MKHFLFLLAGLLLCTHSWADQKNIPLEKIKNGQDIKIQEDRFPTYLLTVHHDGSQIDIYSDKEMEKVNICIYDLHGNILFEQEMSNLIGSYSFQLNASTNELLILMITTTTDSYRGEFYLNE